MTVRGKTLLSYHQLTQIKPEVMNYSLIKRANWWKKGWSSPWPASLRGGLHVVVGGNHVKYNVVHYIYMVATNNDI